MLTSTVQFFRCSPLPDVLIKKKKKSLSSLLLYVRRVSSQVKEWIETAFYLVPWSFLLLAVHHLPKTWLLSCQAPTPS